MFATNGIAQIYKNEQISTEKEVNFVFYAKRGVKGDDGTVYFAETDGQTLTAYKGAQVKWRVNIIKTCGEPMVGKPAIRHLRLEADKIHITFGKHDFASVDLQDGKAECLGAD
jgi:hypothetical protein